MSGDNRYWSFVILIFFTIAVSTPVFSQVSKNQLKREKQKKLERINQVEKIISETSGKKKNTLGELNALNQRIKMQEGLIGSIRSEIKYLDNEIWETNEIIQSLEGDLERLKAEYSAMVYSTHKSNHGINKITFLFSSNSFNQLRSRLKYMEQYGSARQKQAEQIMKVKDVLSSQIVAIQEQKEEKDILLKDQITQSQSLVKLKNKRGDVLASLTEREEELRRELQASKNALAEIDSKIRSIISAELSADSKTDYTALSSSFAQNKNKFPWPVSTGFVTQRFGRQRHAALRDVEIESDGVFIQTRQKEQVKVIFDGDVRFVRFIPGMGFTALVKHGDYFTVYGGIEEPIVKAGDQVKAGEAIGYVVTKAEGVSELWFEIRKGKSPLDPEKWLVKNN